MHCGWVVGLALAALAVGQDSTQDPPKEYDLTWRLPHDRAAVYDVWDVAKKAKRGEFWLLGCELEGRVGATDTRDLGYRFVFQQYSARLTRGSRWEIHEWAFADAPVYGPNVAPLELVGWFLVRDVRNASVDEIMKSGLSGTKEKGLRQEVAVVEGQIQIRRGEWQDEPKRVRVVERKSSAALTLMRIVRISDGAVLGGRFEWSGRIEAYENLSGPVARKGEERVEVVLRGEPVAVTRLLLKDRIDKAIDAGLKWLKGRWGADGRIRDMASYPVGSTAGPTALSLMALLHGGVTSDDPVVRAGFKYIAGLQGKLNQVYDLGLYLAALEGKYLPVTHLEDAQHASEREVRERIRNKITKEDKEAASATARLLIERQAENGMFGYADAGYANLSSTQYAFLGLKAASRLGVEIPCSVWRKVLPYLESAAVRSSITRDVKVRWFNGVEDSRKVVECGWGYLDPDYRAPTGTMTQAALAIAAVCRSELELADELVSPLAKQLEELQWGGLASLQTHYNIRAAVPEGCLYGAAMLYYYLYGLERSMILLGIDQLGHHDWFLEGATLLLSWQKEDGSWEGPHKTAVIDTAWAILFLKRATIPVATSSGTK